MSMYQVGFVSVTNGLPTVTNASGYPTTFSTSIHAGNSFSLRGDGVVYTIASVLSDLSFTLTVPYAGVTVTNSLYQVCTDFTPNYHLYEPNRGDMDWTDYMTQAMRGIDSALLSKVDSSAPTFTGKVVTPAPLTTAASLNLPHNGVVSPTTGIANGDVWTTTAGMYVRINGTTVGPLVGATPIAALAVRGTVLKAAAQVDSVAADIATLKTDFNALLAKLRTAGHI
jgi:hypothetical protein